MQAGSSYGAHWPQDLARLWGVASRSGAQRLVLEIRSEGESRYEYAGHLSITVRGREDWPTPGPIGGGEGVVRTPARQPAPFSPSSER